MIDTIKIRLQGLVDETHLTNRSNKSDEDSQMLRSTGKLGNFVVTQNYIRKETYIEGSLKVFYLGDYELRDLYDSEYEKAFTKLITPLGITEDQLADADLLRLDIGCNLMVSTPVSVIASKIVSKPHLSKTTRDTGVDFVGANKKLIFYDKIAEQKYKHRRDSGFNASKLHFDGIPLPTNKHMLRVELQLLKMSALRGQLKVGKEVNDIFDSGELAKSLRTKFMDELESVQFEKNIVLNLTEPETTKSRVMALMLLQKLGKQGAYNLLNEWQTQGYIQAATKGSIRKLLTDVESTMSDGEDIREMIRVEALAKARPDQYSDMVNQKVRDIIGADLA